MYSATRGKAESPTCGKPCPELTWIGTTALKRIAIIPATIAVKRSREAQTRLVTEGR